MSFDPARLRREPSSRAASARRGRWGCEAALAQGESPDALECLAMAAWWLESPPAVLAGRLRAFKLYRGAGDLGAAVRAIHAALEPGRLPNDPGWRR